MSMQVPILKGVPRRSSDDLGGPVPGFSSKAELLNGRIAMIGELVFLTPACNR